VLGQLLNGSGLNFVVVGSEANPNQLRSVILSRKSEGAEGPSGFVQNAAPATAENVEPEYQEAPPPDPNVPPPPDQVQANPNGQTNQPVSGDPSPDAPPQN
jgi:hypothetical protein